MYVSPKQAVDIQVPANMHTCRVVRHEPFGPANFVAYDTATHRTIGAGSCPALSAHPNYIPFNVAPGSRITLQSLDGDLNYSFI